MVKENYIEMEKTSFDNLIEALIKAQSEIEHASKDGNNHTRLIM